MKPKVEVIDCPAQLGGLGTAAYNLWTKCRVVHGRVSWTAPNMHQRPFQVCYNA